MQEYTQFSGNTDEQEGNYLVLKFQPSEGATVTTKVVNGTGKEPVDCTKDGYCVYRLTDSQTQQIEVTVSKNEETKTTTYDLKGLTLSPKAG